MPITPSLCVFRRSALLFLAVFAGIRPAALAAQSSGPVLRGRLVTTAASGTETPVAAASVRLSDPNGRAIVAASDTEGRFLVAVPGAGRYSVQVRAVGFAPRSLEVTVRDGDAAPITIVLERQRQLAALQIIGNRANGTALHPGADPLAGAVTVMGGEQIARENVTFAQELLRKVPGVYRAEFNQGVVSGDIGIRGFNTESEIASTKLLIDGIPANMNSGVSEMNALFPLEIAQMQVVRGTNDPRHGLFNLAGNVSVETAQGRGTYVTSRLQAGSFGTQEAQVLGNASVGGFSQTIFAGARRSDGFRANSASDKWTASGKWFYTSDSARVRVGVIARMHRLDTDAPGYLTEAQSRTTPMLSPTFSDSDGGTIDTDHGSLHLDVKQTATLAWSLKAYTQRFDRVRFVRFTAAGAQQERVEDERQNGALAALTWRPAALAERGVVLTAGADLQQQTNEQLRFRTLERQRQATLRDQDFTLDNRGGYVQASGRPVSWLSLTAAVRADHFDGAFTNNLPSPTSLPVLNYGWITQPKVSASVRVNDRLSSYANFGRGFQIGTGIAAYGRAPLRASINDGFEVGVVSNPTNAWSVRAGYWEQRASDEVRLRFDNSGDSENIGRTQRRGVDLESALRLPRGVQLWAAGTSQRAVLVEPGRTNAAVAGNLLNHVPTWTAKYGAEWSPRVGLTASAWAYAQGNYHLTQQNNRGRWGDMHTVNADVSWRWRVAAIGVGVTNLFDRYMEYVWWDGAQTLHSPASSRALFLTVTFDR
ncbi:TonB-dependent receptor [Gemmatimonas sp.]|jgi:iron complex outermembrane receptor protein|uniref:TonB-dependent receptor n=1 Tax=Gemmatimonas sp. TaxID=1962908 RepID=UPI0037C0747C